MKKQSLNGIWSYRVGCGEWTEREVPFSTLAVGHSECKRTFDLEYDAPRVELKLEGITYAAKVFLNGEHLGDMLPYTEYTFDVKEKVKSKNNEITVLIEDLKPAFGPVAGWENFGGIIRDVYIVYKNEESIEDVFFYSDLKNQYRDAVCHLEFKSENADGCVYDIDILYGGNSVKNVRIPAKNSKCEFEMSGVKLWSTDEPNLYEMQIKLLKNEEIKDAYAEKIGFREIKCDRHRFIINGEQTFLRGVCKHEMIGDSGHVVSPELIKKDLEMIKALGCNFVRLVHYPHSKVTLDIADEIGIMVSEEPGLWWSDTSDPEIAGGSIEVLRRTILRDRNHPSVAFWLCFNECLFTEKFLVDSANMCKKTDPTRLVSGANCMSDEDTLKYYEICGFDFYTMHPYSQTFDRSMKSAKLLTDKPLVFTEWGGHFVYDNPKLMREFIYEMRKLYEKNSDSGALAGAFLWCFADVNDFNRERPAVVDGRLYEGLVDYDRNPHICHNVFKSAWEEDMCSVEYKYELCTEIKDSILPFEYIRGGTPYSEIFTELFDKPKPSFFDEQRPRRIKVGPVCDSVPYSFVNKVPYVLKNDLEFSLEKECCGISILGGTDLIKGYPLYGEIGDPVADLTVVFDNGEEKTYTLRRGIELTTAFATYRSSKIDPIASEAKRFMEFSYDGSYERYVMNKIDIGFDKKQNVKSCRIRSLSDDSAILVYAVLGITD